MSKSRQRSKTDEPKAQLRHALAKHADLRELRELLEQYRREWRERTPPADQFSINPDNETESDENE